MKRARNRLGVPELSTAEAFGLWLIMLAVFSIATLGLLSLVDWSEGIEGWLSGVPIWASLLLVMLTPKRRKDR